MDTMEQASDTTVREQEERELEVKVPMSFVRDMLRLLRCDGFGDKGDSDAMADCGSDRDSDVYTVAPEVSPEAFLELLDEVLDVAEDFRGFCRKHWAW